MDTKFSEVLALAKGYDVIPVSKEVRGDLLTPIALLCRIRGESRRCFLLESAEGGERPGRYSFLGFDPVLRVQVKEGRAAVESRVPGIESRSFQTKEPYGILREILGKYRAPRIEGQPPFTGGFVGYFAYAMMEYGEPKLHISRGDAQDMDLMLFDRVIAYDHLRHKVILTVNMRVGSGSYQELEGEYKKACAGIQEMEEILFRAEGKNWEKGRAAGDVRFSCNRSKEEYCAMAERAKEYILDGDIFQAVLSRRFESPYEGSLINAYRVLRSENPSPYMVYLAMDGDEIISASPETLIRLADGRLTTFPVAGSRPRGKDRQEDEALERELLADEKELAEHDMLVDLGRNDIGRAAEFGSVKVTKYKMVHRYSKIMHICSQVEGDLKPGLDGCAAIEALLPAGTLSGAPKIRACEIIEELEGEPRGVYGGALGYLDLTGNMDACIAIRMAVKMAGRVSVQAGGGIVADSIPEREYEESGNKARAVIEAVLRAEEAKG